VQNNIQEFWTLLFQVSGCWRYIKPPRHFLEKVVPQNSLCRHKGDLWEKPERGYRSLWMGLQSSRAENRVKVH